jgi:hypothetical protein
MEQSYPQRYYVSCPALDLDLVKDFHTCLRRRHYITPWPRMAIFKVKIDYLKIARMIIRCARGSAIILKK